MSSMRNAIERRSHRERAQPLERKRLGLLEKHKDYSLRAKDYNKKKAQLKALRQKAATRNEDEFYFGMLSRRGPGSAITRGKKGWQGTVDGDRGNKVLDMDTARLLKTQDIGYLRTMRNVIAKEVTDLEQRATIAKSLVPEGMEVDEDDGEDEDEDDEFEQLGGRNKQPKKAPRKIVFAGDEEERDQAMGGPEGLDEDDEDVEDMDEDRERGKAAEARRAAARAARAVKLRKRAKAAQEKLRAVTEAENRLDMQRARMAKTPTVPHYTNKGKKIKVRERKR